MFTLALSFLVMSNAKLPMNAQAVAKLDAYDVVWSSPSKDAAGSMPIGNGEVVLNVWVEDKTGDLLFYIARTDALSEISRVLKLGRVRVHLDPNPFRSASDFRQHLNLRNGRIEISGGGTDLNLFVNSGSNAIDLSGNSNRPVAVTASIECWRNSSRVLPKAEEQSAWSVHDAPFELIESPDVFLSNQGESVTWYHRNETSVVPQIWANQSLTGLRGAFDPIIHRTFGGRLTGDGFVRSGERSLKTQSPTTHFHLSIATHTAQRSTVEEWLAGLQLVARPSATKTALWWQEFWDRS